MKHVNHFGKFVNEQVEYHRILNPAFWQGDEFDPDTRKKLLRIAQDFYGDLKVDVPIIDIFLIGSMVNFSWSKYSDLDVHMVLDYSKIDENIELVREALDGKRFMWNLRHPVVIKEYDVELYVQDVNHVHISAGTYSLMKGKWVTKPKWDPPAVDNDYIMDKVQSYEHEIVEIDKLVDQRPDPDDAKNILNRVKVLKGKITKARDASLKKDGEFSVENLVFKELRHTGWIKKLIDLGAKAYKAMYADERIKEMANRIPIIESKVNSFLDFIYENYDDATKAKLQKELEELNQLSEFGVIGPKMLDDKRKQVMRGVADHNTLLHDPVIGPMLGSDVFAALQSPQFAKIQAMGFKVISTPQQIVNGTLVLKHPISDRYTLGIFKSQWLRKIAAGTQNPILLKTESQGVKNYLDQLEWIANQIDVTSPRLDKHSVVAMDNKKTGIQDEVNQLTKVNFIKFGIEESIYNTNIKEEVARYLSGPNGEAKIKAKVIANLLETGILPTFDNHYNRCLTPQLERIITERQLKWTNLHGPSSWATLRGQEAGLEEWSFYYDLRGALTGSALKYYEPMVIPKIDFSKSGRSYIKGYKFEPIQQTVTQDMLTQFINTPTLPTDLYRSYDFNVCKIGNNITVPGPASFYRCNVTGKVNCEVDTSTVQYNDIHFTESNGRGTVNYEVHGRTFMKILKSTNCEIIIMINGTPLDYILSKNNIDPMEVSYDDQGRSDTSYRNYHIYIDYPAWEAESTDASARSWTSRRSVSETPHKILILNSNDVLNPQVLVH